MVSMMVRGQQNFFLLKQHYIVVYTYNYYFIFIFHMCIKVYINYDYISLSLGYFTIHSSHTK